MSEQNKKGFKCNYCNGEFKVTFPIPELDAHGCWSCIMKLVNSGKLKIEVK